MRCSLQMHERTTRCLTRLFVIAAGLALPACTVNFEGVHQRVHETIASGSGPTVHISNDVGNISITAWNNSTVDIEATKSGRNLDAIRDISIAVHRQDRAVFVATKYKSTHRAGGVDYVISVPVNASLEIANDVGNVDVAPVQGNVEVLLQIGQIYADLGNVHGERSVDLSTATGNVRVSMARDSNATIKAHTAIGKVSMDFPAVYESRDDVTSSAATAKLGSGTVRIALSTTTGSINVMQHS